MPTVGVSKLSQGIRNALARAAQEDAALKARCVEHGQGVDSRVTVKGHFAIFQLTKQPHDESR